MIKTRKEYIDGIIEHSEYYAQFVTDETKKAVLRHIGKDLLLSSRDEHMNDIPLYKWDLITHEYNREAFKESDKGGFSQSSWVCIAKEAGRQVINELRKIK